jgi:hypothetical protein
VGSVPNDDVGEWFGDDESAPALFEFGAYGSERVAQAEPGEPELRLTGWAKGGAGEAGQFLFGGFGGGAADLLATADERDASVVFFQNERGSIGQFCLC